MTDTVQTKQQHNLNSRTPIILISFVAIITLTTLFFVAYEYSNGTAYSVGQEMGVLLKQMFSNGPLTNGIGLGSILAVMASWERNKSILWSILHAAFGWVYVIYFTLTRVKNEAKNKQYI